MRAHTYTCARGRPEARECLAEVGKGRRGASETTERDKSKEDKEKQRRYRNGKEQRKPERKIEEAIRENKEKGYGAKGEHRTKAKRWYRIEIQNEKESVARNKEEIKEGVERKRQKERKRDR